MKQDQKTPTESWRAEDVKDNPWGGINKQLKEIKKNSLKNPLMIFQSRRDH